MHNTFGRGEVQDARLVAKIKDTKNPRPRIYFPRTDSLEAKDRIAPGQGQGPELGTRYMKSSGAAAAAIWQKKQRRCRLSLLKKKVAPLPLLACKTAAAAVCRCRYFKKINSTKNDGIQIRYLMVKFQLYLRKLIIQAF